MNTGFKGKFQLCPYTISASNKEVISYTNKARGNQTFRKSYSRKDHKSWHKYIAVSK